MGASLLSAATAPTTGKPKTYALAGISPRGVPPAELVEKAARAVEAKMTGMTPVANPEDADHYVEVLFRKDTFEIYVDALPYTGRKIGIPLALHSGGKVTYERSMELADIANTERALGIESHP
jgi:hypothetical protein